MIVSMNHNTFSERLLIPRFMFVCHCEEARRSNLMTFSNNSKEIASLRSQ
jgi:hypothetical protein